MRAALLTFDAAGCSATVIRTVPGLPDCTASISRGAQEWRSRLTGRMTSGAVSEGVQSHRDRELLQLIDDVKSARRTVPLDGIEQTIRYMEQHYDRHMTRDTLARIAMLTPGAYCRSFKRNMGCTPTQYLQHLLERI